MISRAQSERRGHLIERQPHRNGNGKSKTQITPITRIFPSRGKA